MPIGNWFQIRKGGGNRKKKCGGLDNNTQRAENQVDIYYFSRETTPHLDHLIRELGLVDGLPFTVSSTFKCDMVTNTFFLSLVVPQSPRCATWKTYAEQLSLFFRFLSTNGKRWRDANQGDLLSYYRLRRIQNGTLKISARSWNVFAAAAKRFYKWALCHEHISILPFDYKTLPAVSERAAFFHIESSTLTDKSPLKDIKYMTEDDFRERFLPSVIRTREGVRNALFCRLLMRSGLRADEAVKLKVAMLPDPENATYGGRKTCPLTVVGKGDRTRTIRIPKSWLRDVQHYIEWDRADAVEKGGNDSCNGKPYSSGHQGYLFLTSCGTPISYSAMYAMMRTAGEKAGFNFKAHPHMLRHSYAIYQLTAMIRDLLNSPKIKPSSTGEAYRRMIQDPLRKLQLLMGHSSITTTFIYLDYIDDIDNINDVSLDQEGFDIEGGT